MDILKILSIKNEDKDKWVKYYELETYKYYDYIINILPNNQDILEIGSGGGVFYTKQRDILINRNNKYTCIDIHAPSIEYCKKQCDYVDFYVKDICEFTDKDLKRFDLLLLVQSYMLIPNIEKILKEYFKVKPNGCIMMVNTIFPDVLRDVIDNGKKIISLFGNVNYGKALTFGEFKKLEEYLDRKLTNIHICKALSGFDEYLTIIR